MRVAIRGWRSGRIGGAVAVPGAAPATAIAQPMVGQPPLRLGLGLVALAFYLWIIHSYKLPAGDVAVLGLAVGVLLRGHQVRIPAPLALLGLLIAWALVGLAVTERSDLVLKTVTDLAKVWVISFCVINLIRTSAELRFLIIAWLAVYALYPVRGSLFNQYICQCTTAGRVSWNFIFANPNDLAAFSMVPLGLAAGLAYVERVKLWRVAGIMGILVLAVIVLLTQSRGAILGLGLAAMLLPLSSRRRGRDFFILLLVAGLASFMAPKGVWERLAGLTRVSVSAGMAGVDPERSAESRWSIWQIAFVSIREKPLTGVGLGVQPWKHAQESARRNEWWTVLGERDTHSSYVRLTAEAGFVGLAIYLTMWGAVFVKLRRSRRLLRSSRPREHQMLLFIEFALLAYLIASTFGTYTLLAFNYLIMSVVWLSAEILAKDPWFVPVGRAGVAAHVPRQRSVP